MIYGAHVKGMTMRHPEIPEEIRGTYAGMAHPAVIGHLTDLGVTAVELMPVHQFADDPILQGRGLANYWGYNTIGYFAPHNGYSSLGTRGEQVGEFKSLVKALHASNIEVTLDVVYTLRVAACAASLDSGCGRGRERLAGPGSGGAGAGVGLVLPGEVHL